MHILTIDFWKLPESQQKSIQLNCHHISLVRGIELSICINPDVYLLALREMAVRLHNYWNIKSAKTQRVTGDKLRKADKCRRYVGKSKKGTKRNRKYIAPWPWDIATLTLFSCDFKQLIAIQTSNQTNRADCTDSLLGQDQK